MIDSLPKDRLLLLDKLIPQVKGEYAAVYENFEKNIYEAMEQALPQLSKYHTIKLIFPEHTYYPGEIVQGLRRFCHRYAFNFSLIHEVDKSSIEKVKKFMSAGLSMSPNELFLDMGINISDERFWNIGLNEIDSLLKEAENLSS